MNDRYILISIYKVLNFFLFVEFFDTPQAKGRQVHSTGSACDIIKLLVSEKNGSVGCLIFKGADDLLQFMALFEGNFFPKAHRYEQGSVSIL